MIKKSVVKRLLLSLIVVALACSSLVALVGCQEETVLVTLNYTITTQFECFDSIPIGDLLTKPSDPTFLDSTFNDGIGGISGGWSDFEFPLQNPRMAEGYDINKNYYFVGWYKEPEFISEWKFSEDRIYKETTLFAKWIEKTW